MEEINVSTLVGGILWVIFSVGVWVLYHKLFDVYYFNFSKGLLKEVVTSAFVGVLLMSATLYLWWLSDIILIIAGIIVSEKTEDPRKKKTIIIVFVIFAIIIALAGISAKSASIH